MFGEDFSVADEKELLGCGCAELESWIERLSVEVRSSYCCFAPSWWLWVWTGLAWQQWWWCWMLDV